MSERRKTHRSKALLTADFQTSGVIHKVTVRNLSSTGARIETSEPTSVGQAVELSRGRLKASGTVAWAKAGECGLHFDSPITIHHWLPRSAASSSQQRVDAVVARIRAGETLDEDGLSTRVEWESDLAGRISEELNYVGRLLDGLGDALVDDPYVATRHSTKLQTLDIAIQILGHLGTLLNASDPRAALAGIGMDDLRRRLTRKSL